MPTALQLVCADAVVAPSVIVDPDAAFLPDPKWYEFDVMLAISVCNCAVITGAPPDPAHVFANARPSPPFTLSRVHEIELVAAPTIVMSESCNDGTPSK